ncbi:MAG: hypothetical protein ACYC1C_20010 [Chloroflexota bacterium]
MQRKYVLVGVVLLATMLVLSGCGMGFPYHSGSSTGHSNGNFAGRDKPETITYGAGKGATSAELHLRMEATEGSVAWALKDPSGATRWEGTVAAGQRVDETRQFEAAAGDWPFVLEFAHATGTYTADWQAS